MSYLRWMKSVDNKWLNLENLDLTQIHVSGVYIIWHGGTEPKIVRIGQGHIAARLAQHRGNHQIMRYAAKGPLMVTWAEVHDPGHRAGIESWLNQQYCPLVRDPSPRHRPIAVPSPFA